MTTFHRPSALLTTLLCTWTAAFAGMTQAHAVVAAVPDTTPPPPAVTRFVAAVRSAHSLTATVRAVESGHKEDSAVITVVQPGKLALKDRVGSVRETLICNGTTLVQWNNTTFSRGRPPAHLADLEPLIDMQSVAGDFALEAFTAPEEFAVLPEYTDVGVDPETGDEHLQAVTLHGTKDLYLGQSDALPTVFIYTGKTQTIKITFASIKRNAPEAPDTFSAAPPRGLAALAPSPDPPLLAIGSPAPDFTLSTLDGRSVTLSSLRGHPVIVDFWASWCPPCRMSMPHVQRIYNDLGQTGLIVLSVNTWDQRPFMQSFLAKHPWYTTTLLYDPNSGQSIASTKYKVTGIPTLYVVGPDGAIMAGFVGFEPGDESKIRAVLAGLQTAPPAPAPASQQ